VWSASTHVALVPLGESAHGTSLVRMTKGRAARFEIAAKSSGLVSVAHGTKLSVGGGWLQRVWQHRTSVTGRLLVPFGRGVSSFVRKQELHQRV